MRIKEVLNAEGKEVYEEIGGRMILTSIIFHSGETRKMGTKTVTDEAEGVSLTYWYEYSDNGPVLMKQELVLLPNFVDTDPDGEG